MRNNSYNIAMSRPGALRDIVNVDHEVRIIRALYPRECLDERVQSLIQTPTAGRQSPPLTYQNTGMQTLPPPNGDIFKLVHGREPSQTDYVRNMGTAALGRFTGDPRSNPYELLYGTTYAASPRQPGRIYVASGFQTASCDTTRLALAKAKIKASVMAKEHRKSALQAGYTISAEPKNEMIAHSEQFSIAVRLDEEGNLLEGSVKSLSLPNIRGTSIPLQPFISQKTPPVIHSQIRELPRQGRQAAPHKSRLHKNDSASLKDLTESFVGIAALAPSSREQVDGTASAFFDEYGSVGPNTSEFVVYDAGDKHRLLTPVSATSIASSSTKRKLGKPERPGTPSKRRKIALPVTPEVSSVSAGPRPPLPVYSPGHAENTLNTSVRSVACDKPLWSQHLRTRPDDARHECFSSVRQSASTNSTGLEAIDVANTTGPSTKASPCKKPCPHGDATTADMQLTREIPRQVFNTTLRTHRSTRRHEKDISKGRREHLDPQLEQSEVDKKSRDDRKMSKGANVERMPPAKRKSRRSVLPYVPPALRARSSQASSDRGTRFESQRK